MKNDYRRRRRNVQLNTKNSFFDFANKISNILVFVTLLLTFLGFLPEYAKLKYYGIDVSYYNLDLLLYISKAIIDNSLIFLLLIALIVYSKFSKFKLNFKQDRDRLIVYAGLIVIIILGFIVCFEIYNELPYNTSKEGIEYTSQMSGMVIKPRIFNYHSEGKQMISDIKDSYILMNNLILLAIFGVIMIIVDKKDYTKKDFEILKEVKGGLVVFCLVLIVLLLLNTIEMNTKVIANKSTFEVVEKYQIQSSISTLNDEFFEDVKDFVILHTYDDNIFIAPYQELDNNGNVSVDLNKMFIIKNLGILTKTVHFNTSTIIHKSDGDFIDYTGVFENK